MYLVTNNNYIGRYQDILYYETALVRVLVISVKWVECGDHNTSVVNHTSEDSDIVVRDENLKSARWELFEDYIRREEAI